MVYKSLNCSGFFVLFFLKKTGEVVTSRCYCSKIVFGSQQNMILQIQKKNRKQKMKMTCMTFLYTIALRNKTVVHTLLHRTTMQMAVSVKKDGNVTSLFSSLSAWLCFRTSRRCVELRSSLLSKRVP